jgi:hypothetical protein
LSIASANRGLRRIGEKRREVRFNKNQICASRGPRVVLAPHPGPRRSYSARIGLMDFRVAVFVVE